jgi:HEAT repeat protein
MIFAAPATGNAEPLETFAQALTRLHIGLTKPALLEALQNPNAQVRGLAAWQLAETKQKDCLPQILQAARNEKEAQTKIDLAAAAGNLGSQEGDAVLESVCKDSSVAAATRFDAARHLFDDQDRACMPELWHLMEPGFEPDVRTNAMMLLAYRHDRSPEESTRLLQSTLAALTDPDISLRLYSVDTLRVLRDVRAIPPLRTAMQVEKEEVVRSSMESTLKSLLPLQVKAETAPQ